MLKNNGFFLCRIEPNCTLLKLQYVCRAAPIGSTVLFTSAISCNFKEEATNPSKKVIKRNAQADRQASRKAGQGRL
jgi:hypothetical protein